MQRNEFLIQDRKQKDKNLQFKQQTHCLCKKHFVMQNMISEQGNCILMQKMHFKAR